MSFNGFVLNIMRDVQLHFHFGSKATSGGFPIERTFRSFIALALAVCAILIVAGFLIAGSMSGIDNPPPLVKSIYTSIIGTGLGGMIPLIPIYLLMGGADRPDDNES